MIKITLVTLMSAGVLGTGAHAIGPQSVEVAAGPMRLTAEASGVKTEIEAASEFAFKLHLKSGRCISIGF